MQSKKDTLIFSFFFLFAGLYNPPGSSKHIHIFPLDNSLMQQVKCIFWDSELSTG